MKKPKPRKPGRKKRPAQPQPSQKKVPFDSRPKRVLSGSLGTSAGLMLALAMSGAVTPRKED